MTDQNQSAFQAGDAVTVLRGDANASRPFMFMRPLGDGNAELATSYGMVTAKLEDVRAWSQDYQDDWAAWLELEALRLEGAAAELRAFANLSKLSGRNAAIEATGKQLREIQYAEREVDPNGDNEGVVIGYWADGHDWSGKREFIPADGRPSLYLFDDEIIEDEAAS